MNVLAATLLRAHCLVATVAVRVSAPVIACTSELVVTTRSSEVSAVTRDIRSPGSVLHRG